MKAMVKRIVLAAVAVFCLVARAGDDGAELRRLPLRGIRSAYVVMEDLRPDIVKAGLSGDDLQTTLELALRRAGIRVVDRADGERHYLPYVYLNLNSISLGKNDGRFAVSLQLHLRESVLIVRDQSIGVRGSVWSDGGIYVVGEKRLDAVREAVAGYADKLVNDILAANQK